MTEHPLMNTPHDRLVAKSYGLTTKNWVGLTDEEMLGLLIKIDKHAVRLPKGLREFARAIESALRSKNT